MTDGSFRTVEFICYSKGVYWQRKAQVRQISQQPLLQLRVRWFFCLLLRAGWSWWSRAVTPDCRAIWDGPTVSRRQLRWIFPSPLQPFPKGIQLLLMRLNVAPCIRHDELKGPLGQFIGKFPNSCRCAETLSSSVTQELVDDLYDFRDHYYETHGAEQVGKKQSDVSRRMEETLKKLDDKENCFKNKAEFLLLKGRCLNVVPDFCPRAEECLSRAVKLDPSLVEAWNILGEQYWKKKDLIGAKNCFTGALQQSKNNVSLRNLSMVLRQLPAANGEEHRKQVLHSVDLARQAVQLDVKDGTSWHILGNAFVSLFFTCGQDPKFSQQALSAYAESESVDKAASSFSELHFNRATLFQYEEMFGCALAGFSRAAALDPSLDEPPERENQLLEYLKKVTELIQNKGKVKARRLRTMLSNLNTSALGPCSSPEFRSPSGRVGSLEPRTLSFLKLGHNTGLAALGKVVFSLASEGRMAFTFGMVDSEETCVVVMVYNAANSWGVLIGDSVVIPEPHVKRHVITHKDQSFDFKSIRVDSPLLLIVNGKKQNLQSQIPVSVSYKHHSE